MIDPTKQAQMERLIPAGLSPGSVVPKLELPEFPPRLTRLYPELGEWARQSNKAIEDWRVKLNITIQNL